MKRVFLCAVLAGACSSRGGGNNIQDFDSGAAGDRGSVMDGTVVTVDGSRVDVPTKGNDVPAVDAGFPVDVPVAVDVGFPEDVPVVVDVPVPMDLGPVCRSDRECSASGMVCDLSRGACVECVRPEDCLVTGQTCAANRCVAGFDSGTPTDRGTPIDLGTPVDLGVVRDAGPGATLITGLGGAAGFGTNCLAASDDGSYVAPGGDGGTGSPIALGSGFGAGLSLHGQRYPSAYLNNNGNISFGGALTGYTADPFPRAAGTSTPIIAPWWADVDTRAVAATGTNQVCFVSEPSRFIATWNQVGYYASHIDRRNTFQAIVTPFGSSGDFDVEFRYSRCEWITGDASGGTGGFGGTPAQAGVDFADGVVTPAHSLTLPGSGTAAVINLCGASNGSIPGVWRIRVLAGVPSFVAF